MQSFTVSSHTNGTREFQKCSLEMSFGFASEATIASEVVFKEGVEHN